MCKTLNYKYENHRAKGKENSGKGKKGATEEQ